MAEQLIFDWPHETALGREDFFVSLANKDAVAMIGDPDQWPNRKLVLMGPAASGKSHLARIFENQHDALRLSAIDLPVGMLPDTAVVVEDMDRLPRAGEETMFHLHNALMQSGQPLLMTARTAPARWPITLPDLASRMQATTPVEILPPDDDLLTVLLTKLFADRQVTPAPNVMAYLVKRMERSYMAAQQVVASLDKIALQKQTAVSLKLAAEVLDNLSE